MEKMSAEQYTEMVQKLANEIVDEINAEEEMEVTAGEEFSEEDIAERAFAAYESAQMRKEAAEADFQTACAYEDAAMIILDQLEDEDTVGV